MDLELWPSGIARFSDGILEITTGDPIRIATRDVLKIGVQPPKAGRLSFKLRYRAGLNTVRTSFWVEPEHADALHVLVGEVEAARA